MFLPPRVRSTRPKSRHAQRSVTLNALPLRPLPAKPFSFAATKISIGRRSRCRYGPAGETILPCGSEEKNRTRNSLSQRLLQAEPFSVAAKKIRIGYGPRSRYDHCRRAILSCSSDDAASIPKFGLEIKNRCTQEGVNRQNLASIPKSGLEIKNRCMQQAIFSTRSLDESLWR